MVRQTRDPFELLPGDSDQLVSEFLEHTSCPDCGSSDALAVYDDGHTYCFSCNTYTSSHSYQNPMYNIDHYDQMEWNQTYCEDTLFAFGRGLSGTYLFKIQNL